MSRRVHLALYSSEDRLRDALDACRQRGLTVLDVHSPYPLHGVDELIGVRPTRLPVACFVGGVVGLGLALWFQYWSSFTDWPIDVGGKPWDSLPAFAPVAFELTILVAGLTTVFGLFLGSGLVPWRKAGVRGLRVTDDRFALLVARPDASLRDADLASLWQETGAVEAHDLVEGEALP